MRIPVLLRALNFTWYLIYKNLREFSYFRHDLDYWSAILFISLDGYVIITNKKMQLLEIIGGARAQPTPIAATGLSWYSWRGKRVYQ